MERSVCEQSVLVCTMVSPEQDHDLVQVGGGVATVTLTLVSAASPSSCSSRSWLLHRKCRCRRSRD